MNASERIPVFFTVPPEELPLQQREERAVGVITQLYEFAERGKLHKFVLPNLFNGVQFNDNQSGPATLCVLYVMDSEQTGLASKQYKEKGLKESDMQWGVIQIDEYEQDETDKPVTLHSLPRSFLELGKHKIGRTIIGFNEKDSSVKVIETVPSGRDGSYQLLPVKQRNLLYPYEERLIRSVYIGSILALQVWSLGASLNDVFHLAQSGNVLPGITLRDSDGYVLYNEGLAKFLEVIDMHQANNKTLIQEKYDLFSQINLCTSMDASFLLQPDTDA